MYGDSATSRIFHILTALRAYPDGHAIRGAWVSVLDLPDDSNVTVIGAVAGVLLLPDQAKAEILALVDEDHDGLLEWHQGALAAFTLAHQFEGAIDNLKAHYSEADLRTLRHASFQVNKAHPLKALEPEDVTSSVDETLGLLQALAADPELDDESRALLVRAATRILNALCAVKVAGAQGVRDALVDAVGALAVVRHQYPERKPSVFEKFERVMNDLAALTQVAWGVAMIAPAASTVIGLITS